MESHIHLGPETTRVWVSHAFDGLLMDLEARAEHCGGQVDWSSLSVEIEQVELKGLMDTPAQRTLVLRANADVIDKEEK